MHKYSIALAVALVLMTNMVIFWQVTNNISNSQRSIILSERELQAPYYYNRTSSKHSNALTMHLKWRGDNDMQNHILTDEEIKKLNINLHDKNSKTAVYFAVELNGAAYQQAIATLADKINLADAEKQKQHLTEELELFRQTSTRLYYLDAALSADSLLAHYQTRDDVLILRGTVFINSYNSTHTANLISNDQQQMQLSKPLTDKLVQILGSDDIISSHSQLPRYQIKLAEGGNYNPWISDVMPLE